MLLLVLTCMSGEVLATKRERDSHSALNGMLCKYSDPTVYSDDGGKTWKKRSTIGAFIGKPGEDYQCRCLALPYVSWD